MKVLHLLSFPTMTGPADPALGLARAQMAAGLDVRIAIDRLREGNMIAKVQAAGVPFAEGLTLSTKASPWQTFSDLTALPAMTRPYDVVHVHASHEHALAAFGSRGRSLVRSIHHPRGADRRGLQSLAYRRTDAFILVAEAHRQRLIDNYAIPADRTLVVAGAVDEDRFRPDVNGGAIRAAEKIPADAFVFGMIARIKPGRGHDLALAAFDRIRQQVDRDVRLVLIGKGEGEPAIDQTILERGLSKHVVRYGFRDADLPEAIRSCDVTMLLEEGNDAGCRAVLESLAVGVPVIGAEHPAIADALDGGAVGWTIPIRQVDALVEAMLAALALSPAARSEMGDAGRRRILERHTDAGRAERVTAFYRRILGP